MTDVELALKHASQLATYDKDLARRILAMVKEAKPYPTFESALADIARGGYVDERFKEGAAAMYQRLVCG